MSMTSDCDVTIPPIFQPFRTGSYLIYDYPSDDTMGDHFRRGPCPSPVTPPRSRPTSSGLCSPLPA